MSEPIEEGTVLGGRYRVTGLVANSDEQDLVLTGTDDILNRRVAILVASDSNAAHVAESARQIAIGERSSAVQVLDLGLSDGRTYLIANEIGADELLELVYPPQAAPYVEPFYTDTLGSEIFGESRQLEPEIYEDDEEYYGTLQADYDDGGKPSILDRFANRISRRRNERAAAAAAGALAVGPQTQEQALVDAPVPPAVAPEELAEDVTAFIPPPPPQQPPPPPTEPPPTEPAEMPPATAPQYVAQEAEEEPAPSNNKSRLIVAVLVALVAIIGVAFALNSLNRQADPPVASETANPTDQPTAEPTAPTESETTTVEPVASSVSRMVPDSPELNAEYDGSLPLIIDGNNATTWNSYTFESANFGGFASNMALIVELEEASNISEVVISQSGGSGGAVEILISDTPDLDNARRITTTSFTGPEMTISVSEDGQPATAQYVIVNVTELPFLQGGNRPYGMRIAEIQVS